MELDTRKTEGKADLKVQDIGIEVAISWTLLGREVDHILRNC
jgi:hypothetical protein